MTFGFLALRYDEQLPAHAEMSEDCVAGVQWQPQVLAATTGTVDAPSFEDRAEVFRSCEVASYGARVRHDDGLDASAADSLFESATHDFDFGQLRHVSRRRTPLPRSRRRSQCRY